jgi:phage antirepressor YoqD-like protein
MIMATQQLFSVQQAARKLGVTDSRVRQICREHEIGVLLGRDRVLTNEDIDRIENLPDRRKKVSA